jgi:SAM-dependent methyltransferase
MRLGENLSDEISKEISRLRKMGWEDMPLGPNGTRCPVNEPNEQISFPEGAWELDKSISENNGYWAKHRARQIEKLLRSKGIPLIWEIGAGGGSVALNLRPSIEVIAVEPLESGAKVLFENGLRVYRSTLEQLKFPENSIRAIGMFDVLEHLANPELVLAEVKRVLAPGGLFICTVPAHQWLFSDYDEQIGHFRRYSKGSLGDELNSVGLKIETMKFMFGLLVLPSLVMRRIPFLLGRRRDLSSVNKSMAIAGRLGRALDIPIRVFLLIENFISPPTGLSIISTSVKNTR